MQNDLIYDVGMHRGTDTAYYLSKGFRVVAIEANPLLATDASSRFADAIRDGRLRILNVGIGTGEAMATFWVNDANTQHSSFDRDFGCRDGSPCHSITVRCTRMARVLEEHGVPYYMKIDIEGYDRFCLDDLEPRDLPNYISIEAHTADYLTRLTELGYSWFKLIDQTAHGMPPRPGTNETRIGRMRAYVWGQANRIRRRMSPAATGDSGPFGEETLGDWETAEAVTEEWLHFDRREHAGLVNLRGWYDFHAKLE